MKLSIDIPGASDEDLQRAFAAIVAVFDKAGITPLRAAEGYFERDAWDNAGFPKGGITQADMKAASTWEDAELAALDAATKDWPADRVRPRHANLELIFENEVRH